MSPRTQFPNTVPQVKVFLQMIDLKLATAFIGWTATTFVAHYSVKRILVATTPGGAEVWPKV